MRIITINANGLRAATRKGLLRWFVRQRADVLCVQELRAREAELAAREFQARGFHRYLFCAARAGYSGVAIYSRREPTQIVRGFGDSEFDTEGRYIEAIFANVAIASVYFPSGSSGPARQEAKLRFLMRFEAHMQKLAQRSIPCILCGDVNIAHKPIDLKNWRANQRHPGFTPEERAWMDHMLEEVGYVDAFRVVNQEPEQYTWWSNLGRAWAKNVGWRIDYQLATPSFEDRVQGASIYKRRRFSDHAPLTIDYDLELL
ncbi:MAG TPA: exodeoxyribonuclease III [Gammaproteobacteria bacterium]